MGDKLDKDILIKQKTDELIAAATKAREKAYAPYSHFHVGAAVLMSSGHIFTGCNVENVSYGLSICAERVAIAGAVASGEREIVALAVVTESKAYPCGACLQFIQEFAGEMPPILLVADMAGDIQTKTLSDCLPCAFTNIAAPGGAAE